MYLFSDIVLICRRVDDQSGVGETESDSVKYSFLERFRLTECHVTERDANDEEFCLENYVFRARDAESCDKWVGSFLQARTRLARSAQFGVSLKAHVAREQGNVVPFVAYVLIEALRDQLKVGAMRYVFVYLPHTRAVRRTMRRRCCRAAHCSSSTASRERKSTTPK